MHKDFNEAHIIAFIFTFCLLLIWILHVIRHPFEIIIFGLKRAFLIWKVHLISMTMLLMLFSFRLPFLQDWVYENSYACWIMPRLWRIFTSLMFYCVTLFSYQKAKVYLEFNFIRFQNFFSFFVHFVGAALYIWSVCSITTDASKKKQFPATCFKERSVNTVISFCLCLIHFFVCNLIVLFIIFRYAEATKDSLPDLEPQFQINKRFMPILILSDIIAYGATVTLIRNKWDSSFTSIAIAWVVMFLNYLLNNMLMHYTIFAHVDFMNEEDTVKALLEGHTRIELDGSEELFYWIALPGLQPIKVAQDLVRDNDLWGHVVTDQDMLVQIERFQSMSRFSILCWECRTDEELLRMIEMVE